ncbi:peptidoglycan recognition family protein [Peribacillus acanthi]|uniref:peptidoglycan recognition protein family protein n=1 Tax=Peribacillus acanthi TaxID=2171554 RepID=UPI000D3EB709|nr:peptidoglycan recognition family protein [Peribacillus acanthi]
MKIEKSNLSFREPLTPIKKVDKLVLHHPAHKTWGIEDIHEYHKNTKRWNGIGYNYFITFDGRIIEGRGKNIGAHCSGHNDHTLGICFQGNFDEQEMTAEQIQAGGWLISQLVKDYGLTLNDVIRHKDLAKTSCPGKNFKLEDVRNAALEVINPKVKTATVEKKYRLFTGTFSDKETAEKMAVELKQKYGWTIYIREE